MKQKYTYKVALLNTRYPSEIVDRLNEHAKNGYRLVCVLDLDQGWLNNTRNAIFEKECLESQDNGEK